MASSDAFRFLSKQYLDSLATEDNLISSSDPILAKFKAIGAKLETNSALLINPESIPSLYDLNDTLTEWRILKEQNKSIKRIFSFHDAAQMNERSAIISKLSHIEKLVLEASSRQTNLLLWDRYTFYKPHRITCSEDEVSDGHEKLMVDWLSTSGDDFKAVGIYGMGGSGKTALVKNVLKQKTVGDKFKRIIWACLSQLTSEKEIDECIIKYLLYCLGLDTDSLGSDVDKNMDWTMEEAERRLQISGNYILVLDDMWYCSNWFTDKLLGKLKKKGGGAVVVTSRRKTVAEKIGDKKMLLHLNPRDYKESTIFKVKDLGN